MLNWQAVQPSTGQMVYDEFLDDPGTYAELGTRLSLLQPPEILISQDASRGLGTMLNEWKRHRYIGWGYGYRCVYVVWRFSI